MNTNTADELFQIFAENMIKEDHRSNYLKAWNRAPVFKFGFPEHITEREKVVKGAYFGDKIKMPFDSLKVLDTVKGTDGSDMVWFFMKDRMEGKCFIQILHFVVQPNGRCLAGHTMCQEHQIYEARVNGNPQRFMFYLAHLKPTPKKVDMNLLSEKEYLNSIAGEVDHFAYFCDMVSCPRHFTVKCSPSKTQSQGRSVQWMESKSHYLILGPEHGKALRDGKQTDLSGAITRAQHARRAHTRLLTSEKFTKKRGLQVWVKASWVGPKNWEGPDKKVYVLQEKKP